MDACLYRHPRGYSRFQVTLMIEGSLLADVSTTRQETSASREDRRIFLGLKLSISGFFGVGKFWQVFFFGSLIYEGIFWGIQNNLKICDSSCVSWPHSTAKKVQPNLFWECLGWDFLGVKFLSREFFGFWSLPPFDHPCHLKSGVPPWDRHLIIMDCSLCPWGKKALTFSLNSTRSTWHPVTTVFCIVPSVSVLMGFDCVIKIKQNVRACTFYTQYGPNVF